MKTDMISRIVSNQHVYTCIYKLSTYRGVENFNRAAYFKRSKTVLPLQVQEFQKMSYWCQTEEQQLVSSSWIQALWLRNMSLPKEDLKTLPLFVQLSSQANALKIQSSSFSRILRSLCPASLSSFQSDLGKWEYRKFIIFKTSFYFQLLIIIVQHF